MRPTRWRRSTHVVIGVAVLVLVAALVAVAAVFTMGGLDQRRADIGCSRLGPPIPASCPSPTAPKPTPDELAATLAPAVADPNLGELTGRITDAITGAQLWAQGADVPMQPASTTKVLTAAAALLALDRDARLTTRVMAAGQAPGWSCSRVAVTRRCRRRRRARTPGTGRGADQRPGRPGAPQRYRRDRGAGRRQRLQRADDGAGLGSVDIDGGDIAPMEAVMLDGGRTQPVSVESRRSTTAGAGRGPRAGRRAEGRPRHGHGAASRHSWRPGDRLGAVAAADRAAARDDERLRQRDGRVDRPRGGAHELDRPQSFDGAVQAVLSRLDSAKIDTGGSGWWMPAVCPSTTG